MKIFVGGSSPDLTDEALRILFVSHGQVESASVVKDRYKEQPRGFGFVEKNAHTEA